LLNQQHTCGKNAAYCLQPRTLGRLVNVPRLAADGVGVHDAPHVPVAVQANCFEESVACPHARHEIVGALQSAVEDQEGNGEVQLAKQRDSFGNTSRREGFITGMVQQPPEPKQETYIAVDQQNRVAHFGPRNPRAIAEPKFKFLKRQGAVWVFVHNFGNETRKLL